MKAPQILVVTFLPTFPCFAETQHPDQPARIAEGLESESSDIFEASLEAAWTSRYLAEGREIWNDNGIISALAIFSYDNFAAELWQGWSDGSADREFQGSLQYTVFEEPAAISIGLTHINTTRGGDDDLDASVSLVVPLSYGFEWNTEFYYGFDRHGFYLETGFSRTWETAIVDLSLGAHIGSNFGYVVDGHDGPDHFVLSADVSRTVNKCLTLSAGVAQQFVIDQDPIRAPDDLELFDGTVPGFAVQYSF